jgi:hypothetical protein
MHYSRRADPIWQPPLFHCRAPRRHPVTGGCHHHWVPFMPGAAPPPNPTLSPSRSGAHKGLAPPSAVFFFPPQLRAPNTASGFHLHKVMPVNPISLCSLPLGFIYSGLDSPRRLFTQELTAPPSGALRHRCFHWLCICLYRWQSPVNPALPSAAKWSPTPPHLLTALSPCCLTTSCIGVVGLLPRPACRPCAGEDIAQLVGRSRYKASRAAGEFISFYIFKFFYISVINSNFKNP